MRIFSPKQNRRESVLADGLRLSKAAVKTSEQEEDHLYSLRRMDLLLWKNYEDSFFSSWTKTTAKTSTLEIKEYTYCILTACSCELQDCFYC